MSAPAPEAAPTWIPYNGNREAGFCDVCRKVATWALVRLRDDVAVSLLRTACEQHRPQ
jgi:hypothetical protein